MSAPDAPSHAAPAPVRPRRRTLVYALVFLLLSDLVVGVLAGRRAPAAAERDRLAAGAERVEAHDGGPSVVVIAGSGVDAFIPDALVSRALGAGSLVENFHMSSASSGLWYHAYDHLYGDAGIDPDAVVIAFHSEQLDDRDSLDWAGIGRLYTDWGTLGDRVDAAPDLAAKIDVIGSRVSSLVGHRSWLRAIWSDRVPDYASVPRTEPAASKTPVTYESTQAFIAALTDDGVSVTVVAVPRTGAYIVPDALIDTIEGAGGAFVDLRDILPPDVGAADATTGLSIGELEKLSRTVASAVDASLRTQRG